MAEIFIQNIPIIVNEVELGRALAEILHAPPFHVEGQQLLNFSVFLHRDKRQPKRHAGRGSLTLPQTDLGVQFLRHYGHPSRPRIRCDQYSHPGAGRPIRFLESKHPPRPDTLAYIQSMPYVDPQAVRDREEREEKLGSVVGLNTVQFGWQCRDDVFSIEWDALTDGTLGSESHLRFLSDSNEVLISLGKTSALPPQDYDEDFANILSAFMGVNGATSHELRVVFRFSRVESLAFDNVRSARPGILFTFKQAPAFERVGSTGLVLTDKAPFRFRLSSFSDTHERLAPYTSLAMRVECSNRSDLAKFQSLAQYVHLPSSMEISPPVERNLFSINLFDRVQRWIDRLDWIIGFQVEKVVNDLSLDPRELWDLQPSILAIRREFDVAQTAEILRLFGARLKTLGWEGADEFGATTIADCLAKAKTDASPLHMAMRNRRNDPGVFNCHHVTVTPTRMILDGPYPDQSNRVLRQYANYHDCFLRVNFADEELLDFRWDRDVDGPEFVRRRVGGILKKGITVAGRKFDFLAYSSSALKEHAVWFCCEFRGDDGRKVNAESIRRSLGDFTHLERFPARYGARMSQAFTATEPSITLPIDDDIIVHPDIEYQGQCFTDGIGDISRGLANKIARALEKRPGSKKRFYVRPSAYQFRMAGFKGVLAVNHKLKDMEIVLRKSQKKFDSNSLEIEIAQSFWRPKPVYLNRYLIMILETLGVRSNIFINLQDEAVRDVENATQSFNDCAKFLDTHGCGTSYRLSSVFLNLHKLGLGLKNEDADLTFEDEFMERAIEFAANHVLRVMKHKARIPVKGSYTLVGVVDVHGWLKPNEVFVCVHERDKKPFCIQGKVLVTRSPQVHPGDVQFVDAIGLPPEGSPFKKEHFPNCIVFSSRGERSVPSMLAGGDLDGDEYNVIINPRLFPPKCFPPAAYPAAKIKELSHACTISDIADWVVEYINADILGFVANQFLILADQSDQMACDPDCIKLAELASKAVDFAKSGTPVSRNDVPKTRFPAHQKPDWAAGEVASARRGQVYKSQRIIGILFRRIDLTDTERVAAREARKQHTQDDRSKRKKAQEERKLERAMANLTVNGPSRIVLQHPVSIALRHRLNEFIDVDSSVPVGITSVAQRQFDAYASELRYICSSCTLGFEPLTEEEVLMGTITIKTSQPRKRQSMVARLRVQTDELVKQIRIQLDGKEDKATDGPHEDLEDRLLRGWAAWQVSILQEDVLGGKSFGMIALASIFECVKAIEDRDLGLGAI